MSAAIARPLGRFENFNLAFPIFFLGAGILDYAFGIFSFNVNSRFNFMLISNLVFFNFAHAFITFAMLARLPEYKRLAYEPGESAPELGWGRLTGVFVLTYLVFFLVYLNFFRAFVNVSPNVTWLFLVLLYNLPQTHHALMQVFGISRMYGGGTRLGNRERPAFLVFIGLVVTLITLIFFEATVPESQARFPGLRMFLVSSSLVIFAFIMWLNRRSGAAKLIYLSRLVLWPLLGFSPLISSLAIPAVHAVEYMFLCGKITSRSEAWRTGFAPTLAWLGGAVIVSIAFSAYTTELVRWNIRSPHDWLEPGSGKGFALVLVPLMLGLNVTHFYADRYLFRMRRAQNRAHIAPLLR